MVVARHGLSGLVMVIRRAARLPSQKSLRHDKSLQQWLATKTHKAGMGTAIALSFAL
jgi:hypothetical protein